MKVHKWLRVAWYLSTIEMFRCREWKEALAYAVGGFVMYYSGLDEMQRKWLKIEEQYNKYIAYLEKNKTHSDAP